MHQLAINKMMLSALSSLTFIGLLAASSNHVQADVTRDYHNENNITIYHASAKNGGDKRYYVNGKSFYFNDLTPEQQLKISEVEQQLDRLNGQFQQHEQQLVHFSQQMDEKARAIEDEVLKLEQVKVKFEKDSINMQDLASIADELSKLASINEALLHQKELEMAEIEQKLNGVDLSLLEDIEDKAHQLEEILIDIAKEI